MHVSTEYLPYTGSAMHIDPSGRGRDRTTYVVTKFLAGYIFVTRWGGFQDGYGPTTLAEIAKIAAEEEVNIIVPEDNFGRSEEHTSELQSLMRISYAVFCLKTKIQTNPSKKKHISTSN